ncbi:MAG: type II toxin-antitoxin system RelE/ParE family toxin, partial [Magnetovibrionaceae bacterium]
MAVYELSDKALDDLDRLYEYGLLTFGLSQADEYFEGLLERFQEIAEAPRLYPAVDHISEGYRLSIYRVHSIYFRITDSGVFI